MLAASPLGTELVFALVIFAMGLLGGLLPLAMCRVGRHALGAACSFGGGVFVAAGAIHLLPDASSVLDTRDAFPVATLICSSTMLAFLLVGALAAGETSRRAGALRLGGLSATRASLNGRSGVQAESAFSDAFSTPVRLLGSHDAGPSELPTELRPTERAPRPGDAHGDWAGHGAAPASHAEELDAMLHAGTGLWTAGAMFAALSVHSFLAGLSLGVTRAGTAEAIFAAVVAHKTVAAFALGAAFVRARDARRRALSRCAIACWMILFAAATPIGVLAGAAIDPIGGDSATAAVLTAVAAGTFLYVGLFEVLAKELAPRARGLVGKACAAVLGYAMMAALAVWL